MYPTSNFCKFLSIATVSFSNFSVANKGVKLDILLLAIFSSIKFLQVVIFSIFVIAVLDIFSAVNCDINTSLKFPKLEFCETFKDVKLGKLLTATAVLIALLETSKTCKLINFDIGVISLILFEFKFRFVNVVNALMLLILLIVLLLKFKVFKLPKFDKSEISEIVFLDKFKSTKLVNFSIPDKSEIWQLLKSNCVISVIASVRISNVFAASSLSIIYFDNLVFKL